MLLQLDETCPIFAQGNEIHLVKLLSAVKSGRHYFFSPAVNELARIIDPHLWRIFGDALLASHKNVVNVKQAPSSHVNCKACDPKKLADYYSAPLFLVVENETTDGGWLKLVISKLRPRLRRSFDGHDPHLAIRQAGGITEIPKIVKSLSEPMSPIVPTGARLRVMAMFDSDARVPGGLSSNSKAVVAAVGPLGITYHVLNKRTIENYIPDNALRQYTDKRADRKPAAELIASIVGPARDHYPIKDGLSEEEAVSTGLYANTIRLGVGLGDFIEDLIDNFYHIIDKHDLVNRDGCGELEELLDKLESNL